MLSTRSIGAAALCLCAGLSTSAHADIFQRIHGDETREHAFSVDTTTDGGYVTTGFRDFGDAGAPAEDVLITKYFSDGKIEWQRAYRGPGRDIGYSVQQLPDRGYIVAAESTSAGPGLGILLIRLDGTGAFMWAGFYTGSFMSDPIHFPHPGVAVDQGLDGDFYVTGNFAGEPVVLHVGPGGALLWEAAYTNPAGPDGGAKYAFTDLKLDEANGTVVVSGTSIRPDFSQPGVPPVDVQDAFMMRIRPDGLPIWSWNYDFPADLDPDNDPIPNVRETGDGLDISPNREIILNGRTDFGGPGDPVGTHLVFAGPDGLPIWSSEYSTVLPDGVALRPETAYAAVRFDGELNIVQTGRVPGVAGAAGGLKAWESLTDLGGAPIWFWRYGGEHFARGESVVPVRDDCGYAMAGQFNFVGDPVPPFARGETYLVKNNDFGETGCLERRADHRPEFEAEIKDAPIRPNPLQEWTQAPDLLDFVDSPELELCYDDDCTPGTPCPCDIDGNGILDLADVGGFIGCFTSMSPCGDLNGDGVWDLTDLGLFVSCFTAGCP